jgi:hypothetical protein
MVSAFQRTIVFIVWLVPQIWIMSSQTVHAAEMSSGPPHMLEAGFRSPPQSARPLVWWHWINGNITKEGIRADLEDMRRVGIGGVQLFDVDTKLPPGPVRYGTDAWFDHVRYAIQTAEELGLEVTLHNCPGWSTSGGPWVRVEDSMKRLVWSELNVTGPKHLQQKLPQPARELNFYRDVAVIAIPDDAEPDGLVPSVTSSVAGMPLELLVDGDSETAIALTKEIRDPTFTFTYEQPAERSLLEIIYPHSEKGVNVRVDARLEASDDGTAFRKVRDFSHGGNLFRGGDIALTVPFAVTTARVFRVILKGAPSPPNPGEFRFSNTARIENFPAKAVASSLGKVLPSPNGTPEARTAIPLEQILDLSANFSKGGTLDWQVPAGRWTILRFGYTVTGMVNHPAQTEGIGPEVDKMDARAVGEHFDHSLARMLREAGPAVGKTVTGVLIDSWEARQQSWTAEFPAAFQARRGYDLRSFLPVIAGRVAKSSAESEAFLRDYRRTVGDLIAENHFGVMRKAANERGLRLYSEAYGGRTFDEFQCGAVSDVNVGEFWLGRSSERIKITASIAHTSGNRLVAAESYTSIAQDAGWSKTPRDLKVFGDQAFANGLNLTILHEYAHQPRSDMRPGFTLGSAGSNFGRLNTWWPLAGSWVEYLSRCQFMLQQGDFVADFLLLRNTDLGSFVDDRYAPLPPGFDYDQIIAEQFLKTTAVDGAVSLRGGGRYRAVVLPNVWTADLPLLRHLEELLRGGVPIIGPRPVAPSGRRDLLDGGREWAAAVDRLWGKYADGPLVKPANELDSVIQAISLQPDFKYVATDRDSTVKWLHRSTSEAEIYFLCTAADHPVTFTADFRVFGKRPETYDPLTGQIERIPIYSVDGDRTRIPLSLDAADSMFVVFRRPGRQADITACQTVDGAPVYFGRELRGDDAGNLWSIGADRLQLTFQGGSKTTTVNLNGFAPIEIKTPWQVTFRPPLGEPFKREYERLRSWSEDSAPAVRYFSGVATYRTEVSCPEFVSAGNLRSELNLGDVHDLAEVRVNGSLAGGVWAPSYRLEVTRWLKSGPNQLEVTVANRWTNRLLGENQLPADAEYQTKFKNNPVSHGLLTRFPDWYLDPAKAAERKRSTFMTFSPYFRPGTPLLPAGMIGPVTIQFRSVVEPSE